MDRKFDRRLRNTFHNSGNYNSTRDYGYYGRDTFLASGFNSYNMGCSMFIMDSLYYDDGFRGEELSKRERVPCQNVEHTCRQNQNVNEQEQPSINSKPNNCSEKEEDSEIYVRGFDSNNGKTEKQISSHEESTNSPSIPMDHAKCSGRELFLSFGKLLGVDTLVGTVWIKKRPETPCHIVLPYTQYKTPKNNNSTSMFNVPANKESYEISKYRCNHAVVVETFMKSDRFSIANSLGFKIEDRDQNNNFIDYIKEDLIDYIEDVREFGFDHIIVIGERYLGILFMDCFGRVFDMDEMTDVLWFHGDYLKVMKRVTKDPVGWVMEPDGNIAEVDNFLNIRYDFPVTKKNKKKNSKKKNSKKTHR